MTSCGTSATKNVASNLRHVHEGHLTCWAQCPEGSLQPGYSAGRCQEAMLGMWLAGTRNELGCFSGVASGTACWDASMGT